MEEGLVQEDGEGHNELGRKPILLSLVPDSIHVIGLAVESTFVSGVLANLEANIIEKIDAPLHDTSRWAVQKEIELVINRLLERSKELGVSVTGIGVAMHGIINSADGICVFAPANGWTNVPVAAMISERYQLPVRVENNANAMALGEYWFGNGKGVENLLAVKVGRSIGSGIILGGQLFPGADYTAGEIGHLTVVLDGPLCKCGNYGCLETVASIGAVIKRGRLMLKRGDGGSLLELIGNNPDGLDFANLCETARLGDGTARRLWEEAGSYLGLALANTINILNPTKVLVGGDVLPVVDFILPKVREIVSVRALETLKTNLTIEPVGLGADAVALGAVTLILKELFTPEN
jgi:predicted NBD/HSP70 family sugar kinase